MSRRSKRGTDYGVMVAPFLFLALGFCLGWLARPVFALGETGLAVAPVGEVQKLVELVAVTPEGWEEPDEGERIEEALVAQGYLDPAVPLDYDLQDALHTACADYGVDYALALGLIEVESGFQVEAVSAAGCYGLMQLNPRYFPEGLSPAENLGAGVAYLGRLLTEYGDPKAALTAYNAGHDTGSRSYAGKVLAAAVKWR